MVLFRILHFSCRRHPSWYIEVIKDPSWPAVFQRIQSHCDSYRIPFIWLNGNTFTEISRESFLFPSVETHNTQWIENFDRQIREVVLRHFDSPVDSCAFCTSLKIWCHPGFLETIELQFTLRSLFQKISCCLNSCLNAWTAWTVWTVWTVCISNLDNGRRCYSTGIYPPGYSAGRSSIPRTETRALIHWGP